jgi:ferric-dicitrate binding protein FerR (iron transport regulator)
MTNSGGNFTAGNKDAVEALLEKAAPRQAPPSEDERNVRDAVFAEWRAVTGKVKVRRRLTQFAIAASVLVAVVVSFNTLQDLNVKPVQVATIDKDRGSIYLVGEQSLMQEASDLASVFAGQVIETGDDGALSLEWAKGGALRIDNNTRIEFESPDSVTLKFGQVYFDSGSETVAAITGSGLQIQTEHGVVQHLGTQYMTTIDGQELVVRVREGRVSVDGNYVDQAVAVAGQQMTISGGATPSVLDIDRFGEIWAWVEELAPTVSMDGRSTLDFLMRISRETGLALEFESPEAEAAARAGELYGTIDADPRSELDIRMAGEDLGYRIDGGAIYVSIDSGSRQ